MQYFVRNFYLDDINIILHTMCFIQIAHRNRLNCESYSSSACIISQNHYLADRSLNERLLEHNRPFPMEALKGFLHRE